MTDAKDLPKTPRLSSEKLLAFVRDFFSRSRRYLSLLKENPGPLYILETDVLKARAAEFMAAFSAVFPKTSFYYAVKSNNHPEASRALLDAGFGLDVSSGLELEMALALNARNIVFSGPGKTDAELTLAAAHSDRVTILMDSFGELRRLDAVAASLNRSVRAGVRLTTNPKGLWRKFGIAPEQLEAFWAEAERCDGVVLEGIQFHTSWNVSPTAQIAFIRHLGKILRGMNAFRRSMIRFIDMGGGYWPPQGEWLQAAGTPEGILKTALGQEGVAPIDHYSRPATPIREFAEKIGQAVFEHIFPHVQCRICLEPGRWICNDAMQLLLSVVDKKTPDLVITDAGTNTVGWERFESDYFPVLNLTRPALTEIPCHILGSLCTPHDVWGYAYWGEGIEEGDILLIPTQGAYTYSLRQRFIKPLPRVVTL